MTFGEDRSYSNTVAAFGAAVDALSKAGFGPITSRLRTATVNARVRGAARSQHLLGLAADFAIQRAQVDAFTRAARAQGLVVVNEMNRPGHGAHMHVQAFRAGQVPEAWWGRLSTGAQGVQISEGP